MVSDCEQRFWRLGSVFHVCTPENHAVVFANEDDLRAGVGTLGLVAKICPGVKLITFQLMTNHFHILVAGCRPDVDESVRLYIKILDRYFKSEGCTRGFDANCAKLVPITSLAHCRNVIAYINRNAFVCDRNTTPFTYEWGANRYFFNSEAKRRYMDCRRNSTTRERIELSHSRKFDCLNDVFILDDYVCPMCFCDVAAGESLFDNARQYFFYVAKNVEGNREIANEIGESLYYTDYELLPVVMKLCTGTYGCADISSLPRGAKIEIARKLHYDYNADIKQMSRLLKIDMSIVSAIFGG